MARKPLPPSRPPGTIDLLDSAEEHPTDPDWRADALGRSRHSRLADELRAPLDDPDPARAELVCARITREVLSDYAPALILLSKERRRRAQALTAWAATLFDLALRPGLAGLDGDRLAQINAWEFQTEEALEGNPPGQPVFVMMARVNESTPWPPEALDRIVAAARRAAVGRPKGGSGDTAPIDTETAGALLEALFGESASTSDSGAKTLAPLLQAALAPSQDDTLEAAQAIDLSVSPPDWRRAASYVKRAQLTTARTGVDRVGLAGRLRLLVTSGLRPR